MRSSKNLSDENILYVPDKQTLYFTSRDQARSLPLWTVKIDGSDRTRIEPKYTFRNGSIFCCVNAQPIDSGCGVSEPSIWDVRLPASPDKTSGDRGNSCLEGLSARLDRNSPDSVCRCRRFGTIRKGHRRQARGRARVRSAYDYCRNNTTLRIYSTLFIRRSLIKAHTASPNAELTTLISHTDFRDCASRDHAFTYAYGRAYSILRNGTLVNPGDIGDACKQIAFQLRAV